MSTIRDVLERIESKADWLRMDAENLSTYVRQLTARRSFETMAQDAMLRAELELVTALATVRAARKRYDELSVDDKAA
jgi:hypothetical protein